MAGITKVSNRYYGIYAAEVLRVRYNKGRIYIKAKIAALSHTGTDKKDYPFVSEWAPVALSGAGQVPGDSGQPYGVMFAPSKGDACLIGFEQGRINVPYCLGYFPHIDEMPPEFDNDDYTNKTREEEDREEPAEEHPAVNKAFIAKTANGQYVLLHDKTQHVVIDSPDTGGETPKIELGEAADMRIVMENLAHDFYKHTHPNTNTPDNLSVDDWEEYVSKLGFVRENPRSIDSEVEQTPAPDAKTSTTPSSSTATDTSTTTDTEIDLSDPESVVKKVGDIAKGLCKGITTADDFVNDPVGTVMDGVSNAIDGATQNLPTDIDPENLKNQALDGINKVGRAAGDAATAEISKWATTGDLGKALGFSNGQAIADNVSSAAAQAADKGAAMACNFVNDGYNTLKGWADDAGVGDALDNLGSDVLGSAIDAGLDQVKNVVNDAIGDTVSSITSSVPGVKSGLDTAAAICSGDIGGIAKGLFGMLVDVVNVATAGVLTPFADGIKAAGSALIDSAFQNDSTPGKDQVEAGRS